ncbi:hypothetical protein IE81DRAFT_325568 [Ceraceosorus guamensis]|uniref:peptidylprolyl isomerase n=1 Tax=Ceraceosorus guamensis TaxID=1522189 RepID=A0A316VVY5_9BASI|nr:hypothetical protein IE81DRAFT_325568 [Ceraceosorus guamensis]PWN40461.1 hypothetical protein IE81DRAFT_325568 [Ceraceosorus guamensis]
MSTFAPRASLGMFALRISAGAEPTLLDAIHDVHITNICLVDPSEEQEQEEREEASSSAALNKVTLTSSSSSSESAKATKAVVRLHRTFLPGFEGEGFGLEDESDEDEDDEDDEDDDGEEDTAEEEDEASEQVKVADEEDEEDEEEEEEDDDEEEDFEEESFAVCHLYPGKTEQAQVSLRFTSDDLVGFSVSGGWAIDIIGSYEASPDGYDLSPDEEEDLYSDDDDEEDDDDDEEIDSDEAGSLPDLKRRIGRKADEDDDDDDDDDELDLDSDDLAALMAEEDDEDDEDEDEYDSDASEEEDAAGRFTEVVEEAPARASKKRALSEVDAEDSMDVSTAAEVTQAELQRAAKEAGLDADLSKLSKNQKKRLNKKLKAAAAAAEGEIEQDVQVDAKVAKVQKLGQEPAVVKQTAIAATTPAVNAKAAVKDVKTATQQIKKTKLPSGLEIEDRKVGSGPAAKTGNRIGMRYIGKLLSGKTFDQNTKGKPFNFKLGRGEVIKGWDEGIKGMQVGGERRITIPPALAYGKRGAPPDIPPNATLVFDVKAVEIK